MAWNVEDHKEIILAHMILEGKVVLLLLNIPRGRKANEVIMVLLSLSQSRMGWLEPLSEITHVWFSLP